MTSRRRELFNQTAHDGPRNVLHVRVMAGTGGGPEKTILNSHRHVDPDRYNLHAAYIYPTNDPGFVSIKEQAANLKTKLIACPERAAIDPRPLFKLLRLCRKQNIHIWHGHDYKSNLYGLLLNRLHPMTMVSTAHLWTDDTRRMRLYRRVDEKCLPHYDHVVAVSTPIADHCKHIGVEHDKLSMIPNGIEIDQWQRTRTMGHAKHELGIDPNTRTLGVTGRLNIQKRIDKLLAVMPKMIAASNRPVVLLLIGDGPELSSLKTQVMQLGLSKHVRFCGWQTQLKKWYEAMDAFILPSRDEGLPNSALEAMAMGTPTAATAVGSVPELLDHGRCGIVLDQNHHEWPDILNPWLADEIGRIDMAKRARARIESHYSFVGRMNRIVDLYDKLTRPNTSIAPLRRAA